MSNKKGKGKHSKSESNDHSSEETMHDEILNTMKSLKDDIKSLKAEFKTMTTKFEEQFKSLTTKIDGALFDAKNATDTAKSAQSDASKALNKVKTIHDDLFVYKQKLTESEAKRSALEERVIALELYGRRENLIFEGIKQIGSVDNCEVLVRKVIKETLEIPDADDIKIQRVHRIPSTKDPKPIIVRFLWYGDREKVWAARKKLKNTGVFIAEDLPKEYAKRRRTLYPIMQRARFLNHNAFFKGDRLVIDNVSYNVNTLHQLPEALSPAMAATRKDQDVFAFFTGATPLSNFYRTDISIDDRTYASVEQYFQYCKAVHAQNNESAKKILEASTPSDCKRIGDKIKVNSDNWLPEAKQVMMKACTAKFHQDEYAQKYLLETGDYILAEASKDNVWGIGMGLNDKNIAQKQNWSGQNTLGKILMDIRKKYHTLSVNL